MERKTIRLWHKLPSRVTVITCASVPGCVLLKQHLAKLEKVTLENREHLKPSSQASPQIITLQKPGKQTGLGHCEKVFRCETVKEFLVFNTS